MTKTLREGADSADRESSRTASSVVSHAQHTPLPWQVRTFQRRTYVVDALPDRDGKFVGQIVHGPSTNPNDEADAAFIVRACNHHEALLAALKERVEYACRWSCGHDDSMKPINHSPECRWARAAIANAEGQ